MATLLLLAIVFVFAAGSDGGVASQRDRRRPGGRAAGGRSERDAHVVQRAAPELKWEAEGIESSIGITAPDGLSFVVNGKNDGNAIGDAGTQIGVAIVGAALHPDPEDGAGDRPGHRRVGRLAGVDAGRWNGSTWWSSSRRSTRWPAARAN